MNNTNVALVSISKPQIEGLQTAEDLVSYCARVSNPSNQFNLETAPKLLRYLIDHKHWSPLEMVHVTMKIVTSRAIAAQILRHRSFSFQEFSQRYSLTTAIHPMEWRMQGKTNRQVGDQEVDLSPELQAKVDELIRQSTLVYSDLINAGVAKECSRMVLPLATETTIFMAGTLRSWIHYIDLRAAQETQKEHRDVAIGAKNIIIDNFPIISEALNWK
jgi:thymidylate synthase (FAD)